MTTWKPTSKQAEQWMQERAAERKKRRKAAKRIGPKIPPRRTRSNPHGVIARVVRQTQADALRKRLERAAA